MKNFSSLIRPEPCINLAGRAALLTVFAGILALYSIFDLAAQSVLAQQAADGRTISSGPSKGGVSKVLVKEILVGKLRYVVGELRIPIAPTKVWDKISDYENATAIFANLKKCEVKSAQGSTKLVRQVVKPGYFPFTFDYTVKISENPVSGMTWTRVSGSLREFKGFWKIVPVNASGQEVALDEAVESLVSYGVHMDAGILIPGWLLEKSLKSYMPEVLNSLSAALEVKPRTR